MADNKQDKPADTAERLSWAETPRVRPPWIAIAHGEKVLPPNDQRSNTELPNDAVLSRRDEPIEVTTAPPIQGQEQRGGQVDWTGSKKIHSM